MKKSRRTFTAELKAKIAIEAIKENKTISELAQIYQVHPNLITHWKRDFLANAWFDPLFFGQNSKKGLGHFYCHSG